MHGQRKCLGKSHRRGVRSVEAQAGLEEGRSNCVIHKFKVGQIVYLMPRRLRSAAAGNYEIRQLMPVSDIDSESPRYRVKSILEKHERVVPESEFMLARLPEALFS